MKASSLWGLFSPILFLALIAHHMPKTEALSPSETCLLVKNGTFIADPANCQGWYYCLNGVAYAGKCDTGLLYNSFTASCDYANKVVCAANVTTMCAGQNAVYRRDPTSCQGYCYCTNGVTDCASCPDGQVFDPKILQCVYPAKLSGYCESGSPCLLVSDTFMKNPNSCTGWYRCSQGQIADEGFCEDLYYDAALAMCNYKSEVECNVVTTAEPPTTAAGQTCTADQFIRDEKSCRGYFYCDATSVAHWGQCPEGSQFSSVDQSCTLPYNVTTPCSQDRCEGMSLTFMAVPGGQCAQYAICPNGFINKQYYSCGVDLYFNEELQGCQKGVPDLNICK